MKTTNILVFFFFLLFNLRDSAEDETNLPTWITSNPGFKNPKVIDSSLIGNGSVKTDKKEESGWLIHVNKKLGFGVEVVLEEVVLSPDTQSYIAILPWTTTTKRYQEVKIFSGKLKEEKIRIPATKSIMVVYSASANSGSPLLTFSYKRYGTSYEKSPPTTESPIKKETLYEIQLKGRPADKYCKKTVEALKEAFVKMAKAFCLHNNIPFNDTADPNEMVFISRVSFCPFEWPERELCASIQHSIYVSGTKISNGIILDYELTADHLREMWLTIPPSPIQTLGLTVFKLPETSDTILWWSLVAGFVMCMSLGGVLLFWMLERYSYSVRYRSESRASEPVVRKKKTKLNLAEHQKIPSFMYENNFMDTKIFEHPSSVKSNNRTTLLQSSNTQSDIPDSQNSSKPQMKNYIGSFYFHNKAFEDDETEDEVVQFRKK